MTFQIFEKKPGRRPQPLTSYGSQKAAESVLLQLVKVAKVGNTFFIKPQK